MSRRPGVSKPSLDGGLDDRPTSGVDGDGFSRRDSVAISSAGVASKTGRGVRSGSVGRPVVAGQDLGEIACGVGALGGPLESVAVLGRGFEVVELLLVVAVGRPRLKLG